MKEKERKYMAGKISIHRRQKPGLQLSALNNIKLPTLNRSFVVADAQLYHPIWLQLRAMNNVKIPAHLGSFVAGERRYLQITLDVPA